MQLITAGTGLARLIVDELGDEPFTLFDVGCSGGIAPQWRAFDPNMRAVGIDPNVGEIERLSRQETNADVHYLSGFVDWDRTTHFAKSREHRGYWGLNPWDRLAVSRSAEIRNSLPRTEEQLTQENEWLQVELSSRQIRLPDLFDQHGLTDIDFIKIDVDGPDFLILDSIKSEFRKRKVIGVGMEVNFYGSDDPTDHTFHNTDRFMRSLGFELFGITHRLYSMAALPQRYELPFPAQSVRGRPYQGDAIYFRDLGNPAAVHPFSLTRAKILKLAAMFDIFDKPDHVAELLLTHRDLIGNVDGMLNWLTERAEIRIPGGYQAYMARFMKDDGAFYPSPPAPPVEETPGPVETTQPPVAAEQLPVPVSAPPVAFARLRRMLPAPLKRYLRRIANRL